MFLIWRSTWWIWSWNGNWSLRKRKRELSFIPNVIITWNWILQGCCVNWIFSALRMNTWSRKGLKELRKRQEPSWMKCRNRQWYLLPSTACLFWREAREQEKQLPLTQLSAILRKKEQNFALQLLRAVLPREWQKLPDMKHRRSIVFWNWMVCRRESRKAELFILTEISKIRWKQMWSLLMRCLW